MDSKDLSQLPTSRQAAIEASVKYYFTGIQCPNGHTSKRLVSDYGCAECKKNAVKKWHAENRIISRAKKLESQKKHHLSYIERHKKWRERNREKVRSATRNYYFRNKEKCKAMCVEWRQNNKESARAISLNRLSRKNNADGCFSKKDILKIADLQNNKCVYCSCDISEFFHVDHITPLSRGGSNWPENLQILCPSCNCTKGSKTHGEFIEFLQKQDTRGTLCR